MPEPIDGIDLTKFLKEIDVPSFDAHFNGFVEGTMHRLEDDITWDVTDFDETKTGKLLIVVPKKWWQFWKKEVIGEYEVDVSLIHEGNLITGVSFNMKGQNAETN